METNKVVVIPHAVAEEIESCRALGMTNGGIVELAGEDTGWSTSALNSVELDTLLIALVIGYTRELSEEERLELAHSKVQELCVNASISRDSHYITGMIDTLDALGIVVEGVNKR